MPYLKENPQNVSSTEPVASLGTRPIVYFFQCWDMPNTSH